MKSHIPRILQIVCNFLGAIAVAAFTIIFAISLVIQDGIETLGIGGSAFAALAVLSGLAFGYQAMLKADDRLGDAAEIEMSAERMSLSGILILMVIVIKFASVVTGDLSNSTDLFQGRLNPLFLLLSLVMQGLSVVMLLIATYVGFFGLHGFSLVLGERVFRNMP